MKPFDLSFDQNINLIEYAGSTIDKYELLDSSTPNLTEVTGIRQHHMPTASGLSDYDYQNLTNLTMGMKNLNQTEIVNKFPIPTEIMEHFKNIKCHCMMGLFPEIGRAWLTIDSDIYIWTYEHGRDVAYYDGLTDLIVSVGLVRPKPGVFVDEIKYLLVLTTPIEIVILGVTFGSTTTTIQLQDQYDEMQLMSKPIFVINTENVAYPTITGTLDSRIFLGGRDGCLYEISYTAETNWFGKRCKKINHSQSVISYIVPGFLKIFSTEDSIVRIVVDDSRHLLYVLTEMGSIEAWYIGNSATGVRRIAHISQNDIVQQASNVLRTVDASVFKPVVAICPLTQEDCANLHLIAVTQSGVRLYFSTIPYADPQAVQQYNAYPGAEKLSEPIQPQNLYLLHVRLPPGYTANATVGKPKQVHSALACSGNVLMVSTPQQDQDLLWSLSTEPFPLRTYLAESYTVIPLNGQVWSITEMKGTYEQKMFVNPLKNDRTNKKIVSLTNQGAYIIALIKPVGLLKQLLVSCHGPHHDAVKNYFRIQTPSLACVSAIHLSCMELYKGTEIEMWATQAFLLYGGEPRFNTHMGLNKTFDGQLNNPNFYVSTPLPGSSQVPPLSPQTPLHHGAGRQTPWSQQTATPPFQTQTQDISYSPKHAAMYLYVSRLLRAIWKKKCVIFPHCISSITHEDCAQILDDLYAFKSFLESLPINNFSGPNPAGLTTDYRASNITTDYQKKASVEQNLLDEEKRSINALGLFIKHTAEVLALWKILCEHQFNVLFSTLPTEEQHIITASTFRDLVLSRSDTCSSLIIALVNTYLSDNSTVGAISTKLRDVCPTLYRHEDAVLYKATEIILLSRDCTDQQERQEKLYTALLLCKDAAPDLPLTNICQQFTLANYYHGVIELCAVCASKRDPNNAALHFYNSNEPLEDQEGLIAYKSRMDYYKEIKLMLDHIFKSHNSENQLQPSVFSFRTANQSTLSPSQNNLNEIVLHAITLALQIPDQLLHFVVYEWLLEHNLLTELLNISEPSLGIYLVRSVQKSPDNIQLADILWKYYERNGQHSAATKILDELATLPNNSLSLAERIEYLARAVMCMRSESAGYSANSGVLLKNIEDKLEIAHVQKGILDSLSCNPDQESQRACLNLNSALYTMSELYADFADRFDLSECQLKILHCSHHNDPLLIESIWTDIITKELCTAASPKDKFVRLLSKIQILAKEYGTDGHCFPLAFLVRELELRSCSLRLDPSPVPEALITHLSIDVDLLIDIYARMISMNERVWANEGNEWHLIKSVILLVSKLCDQTVIVSARNRARIVAKAQELTSSCRNLLYPKPDTQHLINVLLEIEAKFQRN